MRRLLTNITLMLLPYILLTSLLVWWDSSLTWFFLVTVFVLITVRLYVKRKPSRKWAWIPKIVLYALETFSSGMILAGVIFLIAGRGFPYRMPLFGSLAMIVGGASAIWLTLCELAQFPKRYTGPAMSPTS